MEAISYSPSSAFGSAMRRRVGKSPGQDALTRVSFGVWVLRGHDSLAHSCWTFPITSPSCSVLCAFKRRLGWSCCSTCPSSRPLVLFAKSKLGCVNPSSSRFGDLPYSTGNLGNASRSTMHMLQSASKSNPSLCMRPLARIEYSRRGGVVAFVRLLESQPFQPYEWQQLQGRLGAGTSLPPSPLSTHPWGLAALSTRHYR